MTSFRVTVEHVSAGAARHQWTSPTRRTAILRRNDALTALQLRGDRLLARPPRALPALCARRGTAARRGRFRARRQPQLELRPVAARAAAVAEAAALLHGQGGALQ